MHNKSAAGKIIHNLRFTAWSVPKSVYQLDVLLFGLIKASVSKKIAGRGASPTPWRTLDGREQQRL